MGTRKAEADIIVIGAGIIGASCAYRLATEGYRVLLLDNHTRAATNAGMGHVVCLGDSPAELALCRYSIAEWHILAERLSRDCSWVNCGTLWVATTPEEMAIAESNAETLTRCGVEAHMLSADEVAQKEPMLRPGLAGGLRIPGDAIVYAPNAVRWLIRQQSGKIEFRLATVAALGENSVRLEDGTEIQAPAIIVANGLHCPDLLPEVPLQAKKGHLLITERLPVKIHHQLVELGYSDSAHASEGTSVAFNVQPRPTGQLLIGSSRQFDDTDAAVNPSVLAQMLARAQMFLPSLANLTALRSWTGARAASPDGMPLLGPHPKRPGVWLAVGHEGLGVTTALASAALLSAQLQNHQPPFDPAPYRPSRFLE